jgi:hypothetical protein
MREYEARRPIGRGERRVGNDERVVARTEPDTRTTGSTGSVGAVGHRHEEDRSYEREIPAATNFAPGRVHWGPIWAGLLTALTSLLLLSLLGLATGLTTVNAGAAAQGGPAGEIGRNAAIWGVVSAILSFLLGGLVAARTAPVFGRGWGVFNGALVFLLALPLILWLAGQGLGAVLGILGSAAGGLSADPGQAQGAAQGATEQARQATQNVQPTDVARAAEGVRNGALGALAGSLLGLISSAVGGLLGSRRRLAIDHGAGG